ncbi:MAG: hypothetical protein WD208_10035 [Dehalococcoidia bacterium]
MKIDHASGLHEQAIEQQSMWTEIDDKRWPFRVTRAQDEDTRILHRSTCRIITRRDSDHTSRMGLTEALEAQASSEGPLSPCPQCFTAPQREMWGDMVAAYLKAVD